jgi:Ca2+-transporting ATPase
VGALETTVTLSLFVWALRDRNLVEARNVAFTVLVFSELFRSFAARSTTRIFWEVGAFSNLVLLAVVIGSSAIQIAIQELPFAARFFGVGRLPVGDVVVCVAFGLVPVTVLEVSKLIRRHTATSS